MKNILFTLFFISISVCGIAQAGPPPPPPPPLVSNDKSDTNQVFSFAEVMPDFAYEGGFHGYLKTHIKYPVIEKEAGKQGTVYIAFIVEKDGSITNVKEAKGVPGAPGLTKEAIRVISGMPNWKPGLMNGKPVRIEMKQPVRFVLKDDTRGPTTIKPSFPGGEQALAEYLEKNLIYPKKEKRARKEGTVVLAFYVDKNGFISEVTVISEVEGAPGLTKEAKRLIGEMPRWTPGQFNGEVSKLVAQVSITFKL